MDCICPGLFVFQESGFLAAECEGAVWCIVRIFFLAPGK